MTDKWDEAQLTPVGGRSWARSWRVNIETALGSYPVLTAWLETVAVLENGLVMKAPLDQLTLAMDKLKPSDLVKAMEIQRLLTELIGDALIAYRAEQAAQKAINESFVS